MKILSWLFNLFVILLLVDVAISNSGNVTFRLWPANYELLVNYGFAVIVVFAVSFILGGVYVWLNSCLPLKAKVKSEQKENKQLLAKIEELEIRSDIGRDSAAKP